MPFLGAHMSIAGGLELAFERLATVGGEAMQIFTRNQRQWAASPIRADEAARFRSRWAECGRVPMAAHDSYLINLAATDPAIEQKSIVAFSQEVERAAQLAIPFLIFHLGSHSGAGTEAGLARLCRNLDSAIAAAAGAAKSVTILLETTAGQGTALGASFEELAFVLERSRFSERLGVCIDTCHIFAAGYDIRTPAAYEETFALFDRLIGIERIRFFHLNDCRQALGGKVDRHEHIGAGKIGTMAFSLLVNDPRFRNHPMVLETPKENDLAKDIENLALLKSLREQGPQ